MRTVSESQPAMVRLPLSARDRRLMTYAKLLRRVARHAQTGFDFDGQLLRPGELVAESSLRPSPDYPAVPILLECAGPERPGRGHNRAAELYILWRYEANRSAWTELARVAAESWDWAAVLGPLAWQAVADQWPSAPPAEACAVTERLERIVDAELEAAALADRRKILAIIHDRLAARAVHTLEASAGGVLAPRGPAPAELRAVRAA